MSCDHEPANEWARGSLKDASYITMNIDYACCYLAVALSVFAVSDILCSALSKTYALATQ